MLSEKAKSRAQQRFFGMVRSAQKGEMKNPSSEVSQTASSMSKSDVKKMASTKHKGLPEIKEGKKKGLWDNIHAKRKRGESPAKKGDKDYPETLNVEGTAFEIDKSAHKAAQKKTKMRNLAIGNANPNEKAAAEKKAGGPKLVGEGAAWTKKSGKNKEGGLNEKGRKSYERENPGSDLKAPQPEGGSRKKSFCARMGGMKKKLTSSKTANDPDSRINKSLRKWKCNEEKKVGEKRHPRDQKELDRAQEYIKKNPKFGLKEEESVPRNSVGKPIRIKDKIKAAKGQISHKVNEAKVEAGRSDYGKASVRNKRKFGREGEPAVFDASGDRGKMIDQRRSDHKAKRGVKEGVMDVVKKYRNKHDEKKPQKAQDAGAKARRSLQRREYASKVSGSTSNVPDNLRDHRSWDEFKKHI